MRSHLLFRVSDRSRRKRSVRRQVHISLQAAQLNGSEAVLLGEVQNLRKTPGRTGEGRERDWEVFAGRRSREGRCCSCKGGGGDKFSSGGFHAFTRVTTLWVAS